MNGETVLLQDWIVMQIWVIEEFISKSTRGWDGGGRWEGGSAGLGHTDG